MPILTVAQVCWQKTMRNVFLNPRVGNKKRLKLIHFRLGQLSVALKAENQRSLKVSMTKINIETVSMRRSCSSTIALNGAINAHESLPKVYYRQRTRVPKDLVTSTPSSS